MSNKPDSTPPANAGKAGSHRSDRWLSERRRAIFGFLAAIVVGLVVTLWVSGQEQVTLIDGAVIALLAYVTAYLVVTSIAFSRATPSDIAQWARHDTERGSFTERYILGSAPGPGISIFISTLSMFVAVVWLPGLGGTSMPTAARMIIALLLIVASWLTIVVSYALTFHADNLIERGKGLDFPGDVTPVWSDYVYFSLSVMTTFGATDVSVTSHEMRRTVTVNAVIAYIFNTVTVGAVVSALTSL